VEAAAGAAESWAEAAVAGVEADLNIGSDAKS